MSPMREGTYGNMPVFILTLRSSQHNNIIAQVCRQDGEGVPLDITNEGYGYHSEEAALADVAAAGIIVGLLTSLDPQL